MALWSKNTDTSYSVIQHFSTCLTPVVTVPRCHCICESKRNCHCNRTPHTATQGHTPVESAAPIATAATTSSVAMSQLKSATNNAEHHVQEWQIANFWRNETSHSIQGQSDLCNVAHLERTHLWRLRTCHSLSWLDVGWTMTDVRDRHA